MEHVNAGVSQGSILGPLLFLIYINGIVEDLECDPSLYADDINLLKSLCNVHDISAVNRDLDCIADWSQQWLISFNATKTVYMIMSKRTSRPQNVQLYMERHLVQRVEHYSYLGVWLNESLTWDKHT